MKIRPRSAALVGSLALLAVFAPGTRAQSPAQPLLTEPPFPAFYFSDEAFRQAIEGAALAPLEPPPTGLTLPHHGLVLDLIADGLALARAGDYERIVLISPDHFRRTQTPGAVALRDFATVLGPVPTDRAAALALAESPIVSVSTLASHEHGFRAILPFFAEWFPEVPVLCLAVGIRTSPDEWSALAEALDPLVTERTLLIQSTDFSHYLTPEEAREKDAETLAALALGAPDRITALHQPDHIDSKAAQWIQRCLQRKRGSYLAIVDNRNSVQYAAPGEIVRETTSYVTQVYTRDFVPASALPGKAWFFGGDFHLGRRLADFADDSEAMDFLEKQLLSLTAGAPLVLNLEGVLTNAQTGAAAPAERDPMRIAMRIAMPTEATIELLKRWKVAGIVLANNHSLDLGDEAFDAMEERLREEGFLVVGEGETAVFPDFDLFAASDLRNRPVPEVHRLRADDIPRDSAPALNFPHRPRIAFLHWGAEYREGPDERQTWIARRVQTSGFDLLVGCHSHLPASKLRILEGIPTLTSLGNLLFDQAQRNRGGVLLEVRFFDQGTFATRVIPLGNLYRGLMGRGVKENGPDSTRDP